MFIKGLNIQSRREFLAASTMLAGSVIMETSPLFRNTSAKDQNLKVHIFSKHLQFLNYRDMAEQVKLMGFDGIDLTIRKKGHVLPEKVEEDLPLAVEAMKAFDLKPNLFTSDVTTSSDSISRKVLSTASDLGFTNYRMGWLKYPADKKITESIRIYNNQLKDLAELNRELGLTGGYQNHSGKNVGAPVWDIHSILKDIEPKYLGCQYDIRHATVEGGQSWELGLNLLNDRINSLVIKDFKWEKVAGRWKPVNVPLGLGMVDFKRFFKLLHIYNINVPVSLHLEYDLGGAEKGKTILSVPPNDVYDPMIKDLLFIKNQWEQSKN